MANEWAPEQVMTAEWAVQIIEEQFPELRPARVKELGEGFDNTVFQVNEVYVFRFPRKEIAVDMLRVESRLLPELVKELKTPIPEPVFIGEPGAGYPWLFVGYKMVHGEVPVHVPSTTSTQPAVELADFLKTVHRFPVSRAAELGVTIGDLFDRLDMSQRKPRLLANIERVAAAELFDDIEMLRDFAESMPVPPYEKPAIALVHGDLHIRNLVVDGEGLLSGVIDWGDTHVGHPAIDLSVVYSFLPPETRPVFYERYGDVDEQTKQVARFVAVYVTVLMMLYRHDLGDHEAVETARQAVRLALR